MILFNEIHQPFYRILCEECGSRYMSVSWYLQTTKKRVYVWRRSERMKNGTKRIKCSPSLKEDEFYFVIFEYMQIVVDAEIDNSSAMLFQTKALIVKNIDGADIRDCTMTKPMWDSIFEEIIIKGNEKAVIHYKTGMIQDMTLC